MYGRDEWLLEDLSRDLKQSGYSEWHWLSYQRVLGGPMRHPRHAFFASFHLFSLMTAAVCGCSQAYLGGTLTFTRPPSQRSLIRYHPLLNTIHIRCVPTRSSSLAAAINGVVHLVWSIPVMSTNAAGSTTTPDGHPTCHLHASLKARKPIP